MNHEPGRGDTGPMTMMALMMAMCVGVLLFAALLPALGFPAGLIIALAIGSLVLIGHRKLMGHH